MAQLVDLTWRQQCTSCHGPMGRGDGQMGPMVQAPDLTRADWQSKVTDAEMAATIKTGRNEMPRFDLPDPVLSGLVARIRSLQGRGEEPRLTGHAGTRDEKSEDPAVRGKLPSSPRRAMTQPEDDKPDVGADRPEIATRALQARESTVGIQVVVMSGSAKGTSRRIGERLRIGKARRQRSRSRRRHRLAPPLRADARGRRRPRPRPRLDQRHEGRRGRASPRRSCSPGVVLKVGEIEIALRPAVRSVEVMPSDKTWFGGAIGQSLAMRSIFGVLERIAPTDATVLLEGETGTGKDVLARAIWTESTRAQGPFVVVDCGAVSYSLLESELFGHERGAFTGAVASRQGAFELADGGTVFLDEIGELPLDVQPKLLRVLETKEFRRVGGNRTLKTNVRVIAATNRNLQREVQGGKFREDLYFRLAVVPDHRPAAARPPRGHPRPRRAHPEGRRAAASR